LPARERIIVIKGDLTQPSDVAALIAGADLLFSCGGKSKDTYIMEDTARSVLDAARALQNVQRQFLSQDSDVVLRQDCVDYSFRRVLAAVAHAFST
jgi:hypothetical protein